LTGLTIRPAAPGDTAAITAIYRPAVLTGTASFELDPPDEAEMLRRFRALVDGGFPYLAACRGADLVGYAYAGPYRPRPAYRFSAEDSIYIAPQAQGEGVGRALLEALIAECTARNFRQLIGIIGDSGHAASIGLHKSLGFVDVGIVRSVGFKHGRWLDQVIMQLPLGPGDAVPPV